MDEWIREPEQAFRHIKASIGHCVELDYPKSDYFMWLFTDACYSQWGAMLTQTEPRQLDQPIQGTITSLYLFRVDP